MVMQIKLIVVVVDSKQPGDTILALPCPSCIGTEGYAKNFFEV